MEEPTLYERYSRATASSFCGPADKAQYLCDDQWVIFREVVLCFATLGPAPKMSHFQSGSRFCWVADKPYRVTDDREMDFVPSDVVGGRESRRQIWLFVRGTKSEHYTYVGSLDAAHVLKRMISGAADNYGEALFELTPTLPSRIWTELGGLPASNPNHLEIDAAFDRLRQTTTVEDRLGILQQFVQYWHGPIGREDGLAEEETRQLSIPRVLRWWYQWAGRRSEITTGQNMLLRPKDLISKDGKLVFYGENQWVYEWATLCNGDDPPVFGRYDEADPWEPENITLSEHLILAAIFEAVMCHSPYGASAAWLREDILSDTANHVPPIAINPWRWLGPTRFYGKNGAFMYSMVNGGSEGDQCYSVWVGAKTEEPLQFLRPFLSKDWDYVAI